MVPPRWMLELTDQALALRFGGDVAARGRDYAVQGRVGSVGASGETLVVAVVRGQHGRTYQTSVVWDDGHVRGTCTCPMQWDCKHVVAVIVQARLGSARGPAPAWQHALASLMDSAASSSHGIPLALQFTDHTDGISLRPLKLGARDKWVKSGVSWHDLHYGRGQSGLERSHVAVLKALLECERQGAYGYSYGYSSDSLNLNRLRADVWTVLSRAANLGVTFLAGGDSYRGPTGRPTLLSSPVDPVLRVAAAPDGVNVSAELVLGSESFQAAEDRLVGRPAHGVALRRGGQLLLGPLARPLSEAEQRLFSGAHSLAIPSSDLAVFATGFLPRLRERLTVTVDDQVSLPEAERPRLVCRVSFSDAAADLDWGFRYGRDQHAVDLPLAAHAAEPPVRDPKAEAALTASLPDGPWIGAGYLGKPRLQAATLRGRALFEFVADILPALQARDDIEVESDRDAPGFREALETPSVTLSITDSETGDWFDLGVAVRVGDEQVPISPLLAALTRGDDHLLLETGTWFSLASPELDHLRALVSEARRLGDAAGGTLRLRPEHAGLWEELARLGVVAEQSASWRLAVDALLSLDALPEVPPPVGLHAELRPYQATGFRWLSFLRRAGLGGILADEMGLGKTLQGLALVQAAAEDGELDAPALVVAPTSVMATWAAEAARFTPGLRVAVVTETEKRRGCPLAEAIAGAHVVITSYTLLRLESEQYNACTWGVVFLDEAQFVKNHASQVYRAARTLRARTKIALTGTPLENNVMDLWSILSIAAPGLFPDPGDFTDLYRKPIDAGDAQVLARLHRRIRPLLLRRTKSAVASELPDKQEQVVPVELTAAHRRLYDRHLTRERQRILGLVGDLNRNRITILASLTMLRQLALAPALVDASYPAQSAKIDTLVELLGELISEGHRALVFSQFTGFLSLVRKRLEREDIAYEYLDGRTRDRAARIAAFREGDAPVFLISLKAGGFGLTLTEADYVFILDPWWNPAAETQAIDRTHRIGQDKPVNVYRLVSADTIEEKVAALQQHKRDLFDSVVGATADLAAPLTADDIRGLLER